MLQATPRTILRSARVCTHNNSVASRPSLAAARWISYSLCERRQQRPQHLQEHPSNRLTSRTDDSTFSACAGHLLVRDQRATRYSRTSPAGRTAAFHSSSQTQGKELIPFLLADVGEGITECEIIKWMVQPGATVEEFDPLCEVQSDKASVEITSRYAGVVKSLLYKEGEVAKVGSALCEIEREAEDATDDAPASAQPESSGAVEQKVTSASEPERSTTQSESTGSSSASSPVQNAFHGRDGAILATPAVRRISREHGVSLRGVAGTGKEGRITKEDILGFVSKSSSASPASASSPASTSASPSPTASTETVPLDPIRRAMFRAMTTSLQVPHFAFSEEVDVTALEEVRMMLSANVPGRYRKTGEATTAKVDEDARFDKITMLPLLIKAMSIALEEFPLFRSTLSIPADAAKDAQAASSAAKLVRRSTHDISIALSTPQGLLTPALLSTETQSVFDLASRIAQLQTRGTSGKGLPSSDLRATGTITLSNIGAVGGGTYTHPVIPPTGQLAIGAVGRTRALPRFRSETPLWNASRSAADNPDEILRRLIMPVSFTGDHRVVEGAELAKFVLRWKQLVETPQLSLGLLK